MISSINNISLASNVYNKRTSNPLSVLSFNKGLAADTVCFTGKSPASTYKTVFEYLAAEILSSNKRYHVGGERIVQLFNLYLMKTECFYRLNIV